MDTAGADVCDAGETPADHAAGMSARTATIAWLALVGATVIGWLLAGGGSDGASRGAAIVAIACVKIYLVMAIFMGLWRAPAGWHLGALAWIVTTGAIVFGFAGGGAS